MKLKPKLNLNLRYNFLNVQLFFFFWFEINLSWKAWVNGYFDKSETDYQTVDFFTIPKLPIITYHAFSISSFFRFINLTVSKRQIFNPCFLYLNFFRFIHDCLFEMIEIMKYFPSFSSRNNYCAKSIMNAHHTVREFVVKQYRNCNESKVSACDSVWEQIVLIFWMGDTMCDCE